MKVWYSLLPLLFPRDLHSLPSEAGGCSRNGRGSVADFGSHGLGDPGTLPDFGLRVVVSETGSIADGKALSTETNNLLKVGTEYTMFLDQTNPNARENFRGFLFRTESTSGTDLLASLTPINDELSQRADQCDPEVGGVTHTFTAREQTLSRISATLEFDEAEDGILLDVTAVISNRNGISEFYWSPFVLDIRTEVVDDTEAPTTAPVAAPTPVPVAAPTPVPLADPTTSPVTDSPTGAPVGAPTAVPATESPTNSPSTMAPIATTDPPTQEATTMQPVTSPTSVPS